MKRLLGASAALAIMTGSAFAQATATATLGDSGHPVYSVHVKGSDGRIYKCKPEVKVRNGRHIRECLHDDDAGAALFGSGGGLAIAGPIAAGALLLVVIAGDDDDDGAAPTSSSGSVANASDLRLKTDVKRVGTTNHGLPLYQFRYTGGTTVYEGVMAQDVQRVIPEAIVQIGHGYMGVKYDMLGIEMREVH